MDVLLSLLLVLMLLPLCFVLWLLFALWLTSIIIPFLVVYWTNYIYAKISFKRNRYTAQKKLEELEEEMNQMDNEEFKIIIHRYFGSEYSTDYDAEQKLMLDWKLKGYKKGIQSSMRYIKN